MADPNTEIRRLRQRKERFLYRIGAHQREITRRTERVAELRALIAAIDARVRTLDS